MQLGLNLGFLSGANVAARAAADLELTREAERLGYAVVWVAEAYGSDAPTVLAWLAAQTTRIDIGSAVMQIPARAPASTAMTAATLDALSGGRFRLGVGVSGPQVSEGWYGVGFGSPLARTREYVEIVRRALRREPVRHDGRHYQLPLPGGPGKALALAIHPVRDHIPVYLAALGPKNLRLAGEIADGWLALFFSPEHAAEPLAAIAEGRRWAGLSTDRFDVVATVPLVLDEDAGSAVDQIRAHAALYLGGMGSRAQNFYTDHAARMGFATAANTVRDLFLAGDPAAAAAAIPAEFIAATSLAGPPDLLTERLQAYAEAGVTTLSVLPQARTAQGRIAAVRAVAEAFERAGLAA
ncbi:MAG: LLM class F420-dependent oxidoreductase [Mycobacteriales bacterium]|nr:MAG: LLM class F420-dependent oxidoreductase [Pseudonocardiales bacterium]